MKQLLILTAIIFMCCHPSQGMKPGSGAELPECQTPAPAPKWEVKVDGRKVEAVAFKGYHYCSFDMARPVTVETLYGQTVSTAEISPRHSGIAFERRGNAISFRLDKAGYYMVRINDTERLFIFAEQPEKVPYGVNAVTLGIDNTGTKNVTRELQSAIDECASAGSALILPAGVYKSSQLKLPSGTHLHLSGGAVLSADITDASAFAGTDELKTRRFIYIRDAKGVRITGHGAICGNGTDFRAAFGDEGRMRLILGLKSSDILIEGVMLQDPGSWNTQPILCENVTIRRVKLMNDPKLGNTDGFDPDGVRNMLIEDCFAYCGDDNVAIKTTGYLKNEPGIVDGVTVRGCVFLTQKSSLKVGTETRGAVMRNILFEDNDVIESDRGMALYISDGTSFENVRYVNNRFEGNWPDAKRCGIHFTVNKRNEDSRVGEMRDILVKDCTFYEAFPRESEIASVDGGSIECTIENLVIAGKKATTLSEARIKTKNASVEIE